MNDIDYGKNALTNKKIRLNRLRKNSPLQMIIGTSTIAKNYISQRELPYILANNINNQVIIIDTTGEYKDLAKQYNGKVIELTETSEEHINIFDNLYYDMNESPNSFSFFPELDFNLVMIDFFVDCYELLIKRKLTLDEKRIFYKIIKENNIHNITEFNEVLKKQIEHISLEFSNKLPMLNSPTNIEADSNLIIFDISKCASEYKELMYFVCLKYVWIITKKNYENKIYTWCYFTELGDYLKNESFCSIFCTILTRSRMYGGVYTFITNTLNAKDKEYTFFILNHIPFYIILNNIPSKEKELLMNLFPDEINIDDFDFLQPINNQGLMIENNKIVHLDYKN